MQKIWFVILRIFLECRLQRFMSMISGKELSDGENCLIRSTALLHGTRDPANSGQIES